MRLHSSAPLFDACYYRSDFLRLARALCRRSVGVALGGGGARALAHLGVAAALEELEIPVDVIGGTSQGAFMAACIAMCDEHSDGRGTFCLSGVAEATLFLCAMMSSSWNLAMELTLPLVSLMTGRGLNDVLQHIFRDLRRFRAK